MSALENYPNYLRIWIFVVALIILLITYKRSYFSDNALSKSSTDVSSSNYYPSSCQTGDIKFREARFESGDNISDCSNKVISRTDQLRIHLDQTNPNRTLCTGELLRAYVARNDSFYGDGVWYVPEVPEDAQFYPDLCRFQNSAASFRNCHNKGIRNILLSGDSNGRKYFNGLLNYFEQNRWKCTVTRKETSPGKQKEKRYFMVPEVPLEKLHVAERGCTHCTSETYKCRTTDQNSPSQEVWLEYIGMTHFVDSSLRLDSDMNGQFRNRLFSADTFLEYLLKYYLPHHGMPDLWILSSPIHHEVWGSKLSKFRADLLYFINLLDIYWPSESQLIILPDIRECPKMLPADANYIIKQYLKSTRNEKIHSMNQVLYRVFGRFITTPGNNIHGFLDLHKITCPVMCSWHEDGGHMKPFWYTKIIYYLFQLLCLS